VQRSPFARSGSHRRRLCVYNGVVLGSFEISMQVNTLGNIHIVLHSHYPAISPVRRRLQADLRWVQALAASDVVCTQAECVDAAAACYDSMGMVQGSLGV
jgi:hypothetical protein